MVSLALGSLITGGLTQATANMAASSKAQDAQDLQYQHILDQTDAEKILIQAREESQIRTNAAKNAPTTDPYSDQLLSYLKSTGNAQVNTQPMPIPTGGDSTPIQPQTPAIQAPQAPVDNSQPAPAQADPNAQTQVPPTGTTPAQPVVLSTDQTAPAPLAPTVAPVPSGAAQMLANSGITDDRLQRQALARITAGEPSSDVIKDLGKEQVKLGDDAPAFDMKSDGISTNDKTHVQAGINLGVFAKDGSDIRPLNPRVQAQVSTFLKDADTKKQAGEKNINTLNSTLGLADNLNMGPLSTAYATIDNAVDQFLGSHSSAETTAFYEQLKNQTMIANGAAGQLGLRAYGALKMEKDASPNAAMTPESFKDVAKQYLTTSRAIVNHYDAIINGPEDLSVGQRVKFASTMDKLNPAVNADGKTPNPNFLDYSTWAGNVATKGKDAAKTGDDNFLGKSSGTPASQDNTKDSPVTNTFSYDPDTGTFKAH